MGFDLTTLALAKKYSDNNIIVPDWNAAESEKGFVKNRTHHSKLIIPRYTIANSPSTGGSFKIKVEHVGYLLDRRRYLHEHSEIKIGFQYKGTEFEYTSVSFDAQTLFDEIGTTGTYKVTRTIFSRDTTIAIQFKLNRMSGIYDVEVTLTNVEPNTSVEVAYQYIDLKALDEIYIPNTIARVNQLEEKISAPAKANIGQTIVVKAIDENGKPTDWEAIDPWIISSSTEGSLKKFKIAIGDDGILTTTEII